MTAKQIFNAEKQTWSQNMYNNNNNNNDRLTAFDRGQPG